MNVHRVEATINQDGTLTLEGLPFRAGDLVEVIILDRSVKPAGKDPYPFRGKPIKYDDPTEPVAQEEWGALQ